MTPRRWAAAIARFVPALLALALPAGALAEETPVCKIQVAATLDMRTAPDGRVSIPVKFDNRDRYFLIDTGGVISTIDPRLASSAHLTAQAAGNVPIGIGSVLFGVGGVRLDHYVRAQNFSIGRLDGRGSVFYLQPTSWRDTMGTIAPEILGAYDDDFDFAAGKFRLVSPNHCPGKVVYWTKGGPIAVVPMEFDPLNFHVRVPVTIDGKKMMAAVDTGAEMSIMSLSAAHRYLDFDEKRADVKASGNAAHRTYFYPFKALDFQDIAVANPYILILSDNDMRYLGNDLILGIGILRQLHMYIAYREKKIYFTPATAH